MPKKKNLKSRGGIGDELNEDIPGNLTDGICERKYSHQQIHSNWDRYRPESPKPEEEDKSNDFANLVNSPSDCNYFQFKFEKNWENEAVYNNISGRKFFNLDLELLSSGLACIPFYDRVGIDRSMLSELDIEMCNKKAEDNLSSYKAMEERFLLKLQQDYGLPKSPGGITGVMTKPGEETETRPAPVVVNLSCEEETDHKHLKDTNNLTDNSDCKQNIEDNTNMEENLEDWLDSVLDD